MNYLAITLGFVLLGCACVIAFSDIPSVSRDAEVIVVAIFSTTAAVCLAIAGIETKKE